MRQASKKLKVFAGNANMELAVDICRYLGMELGLSEITRFKDGEIRCKIGETVRGSEVFIVQPLNNPSAEHIMELLIMIDAMKRASAKVVCPVIPYFAYARQDRKSQPRDPISAKLCQYPDRSRADRWLHWICMPGRFRDSLIFQLTAGMPIIAEYLLQKKLEDVIVVSPMSEAWSLRSLLIASTAGWLSWTSGALSRT